MDYFNRFYREEKLIVKYSRYLKLYKFGIRIDKNLENVFKAVENVFISAIKKDCEKKKDGATTHYVNKKNEVLFYFGMYDWLEEETSEYVSKNALFLRNETDKKLQRMVRRIFPKKIPTAGEAHYFTQTFEFYNILLFRHFEEIHGIIYEY